MNRATVRLDEYEFALCLTHDVDRPYKGYRGLYYALRERPAYHLRTLVSRTNPYWQFDQIRELESDLGVKSAFYFLDEPNLLREGSVGDWLSPVNWLQFLGGYDVTAPEVAAAMRTLDEDGWEVGLHGSILSSTERDRLAAEKGTIEGILEHPIMGGRQHYLSIDGERTWHYQADVGLRYDTSLGSSTDYGFEHGYAPIRPFDDGFVVYPLTVMEVALPGVGTGVAWAECERLLAEAAANDAVMTVLWHPRYFNPDEFPGYRGLYRRLVRRALEMGAWVGPPGQLYDRIDRPAAEPA